MSKHRLVIDYKIIPVAKSLQLQPSEELFLPESDFILSAIMKKLILILLQRL